MESLADAFDCREGSVLLLYVLLSNFVLYYLKILDYAQEAAQGIYGQEECPGARGTAGRITRYFTDCEMTAAERMTMVTSCRTCPPYRPIIDGPQDACGSQTASTAFLLGSPYLQSIVQNQLVSNRKRHQQFRT